MNRPRLLAVLVALVLAFGTADYAQSGSKSYSSGGRSFSSGGRSYGSSNRSYSSTPRPSAAPKPFSGSGNKTYSSSSGNKSYSSPGFSPPRPAVPPTPVIGSGNPTYSPGGGKSYSSGNKSYSSPGPATPSTNVAPRPVSGSGNKTYTSSGSGGGRSYSSGNNSYSSTPSAFTPVSPSGSSKPKSGAFDGNAAAAQKRVESKANYVKGPEPRSTYTSPTGQSVPINPATNTVQQIRSMNRNVYITRETRIYSAYSPYYSQPLVLYNDPYNSFFWWWLLDRSFEERAQWAYYHRYDMDSARYQALLARDAGLEARIQQLEAAKTPPNPNYVPAGIAPDLQYTDDYVDAVYNPHTVTPAVAVTPGVAAYNPRPASRPEIVYYPYAQPRARSHGLGTAFWILVGGAVLFAAIYLVFFHNWQFAGKEP